jgi:hypothetical protein
MKELKLKMDMKEFRGLVCHAEEVSIDGKMKRNIYNWD